jgi:drug/metabolite transporter (DMT)-like permease
MIINYLWPMMAVVAGCILMKEKMTVRKVIAVGMSFAGVAIVTSNGSLSSFSESSLTGTLCCALAAVSYGLFVALNKRLSYAPMVNMMLYYAQSAILAFAVVLLRGGMPAMNGVELLGFLWIGVGCHAIAYVSWALAMKYGDTAKVANLAYITPFLAMVVAHFVLGDPITLWSVGGLAVIVAGIFLQMKE